VLISFYLSNSIVKHLWVLSKLFIGEGLEANITGSGGIRTSKFFVLHVIMWLF
jgi:hypothetical protein